MRPPGSRPAKRYPAAAEHPRRTVHAVREPVLRRVPGLHGGGLRGRVLQPARFVRLHRGVGPRDPRAPVGVGPGWGTVDHEDVMAVHRRGGGAVRLHRPRAARVMGGSYGGYMTSWIVGHTDRFQGAISERAVNHGSRVGLERPRLGLQGRDRVVHLGGPRGVGSRMSPADLRAGHHDAAADPAFGERPALPDRAGRTAVHDPSAAQARRRVRPVPGGGPRADALGGPVHRVQRFEIVLDGSTVPAVGSSQLD